ncbi:MAG: hypothetical protein ACRDGQ_09900 [Candidatus Limnocylindrales bacterium]
MPKPRNSADEFGKGLRNSKAARATGEDDVEGHGLRTRITSGERLMARNVPDDAQGSSHAKAARATGDDDVEGHWMPDAGTSMRLARARNSDIERESRQHQLANEARQNRLEHDPKRTHQKG